MYRALLISLALHLAILISPGPPWPGAESAADIPRRAVLKAAVVSRADVPVVTGNERVDKKMPATRRPPVVPSRIPVPSVLPSFLPSTVAMPVSNKNSDQGTVPDNLAASSLPGEGEREYRLSVAREARKFKSYPSAARSQAWEGAVLVTISMSLEAPWPEISLRRSSGYDEIDRLALEMIGQAVKIAAIPSALQGRRFQIVVPVEYRLAD